VYKLHTIALGLTLANLHTLAYNLHTFTKKVHTFFVILCKNIIKANLVVGYSMFKKFIDIEKDKAIPSLDEIFLEDCDLPF